MASFTHLPEFENDVNQYGYLTRIVNNRALALFENDVNQYGYLTDKFTLWFEFLFENDVNQYGYLTIHMFKGGVGSLRMM